MMLDRPEGMLGKLFTQLHFLRIAPHPTVHLIQEILVHPTSEAAATLVAGALSLYGTLGASAGGIVLDVSVLLGGLEAVGQLLSCRAPIAILLRIVAEVFLNEESTFAASGGSGLGNIGCDASLQTGFYFLTMVVTHIG